MSWIIYLGAILIIAALITLIVFAFRREKPEPIDEMSGSEFEDYMADILYANGIEILEVTKASGDFGADIIAVFEGERTAIQCKRYSSPIGVKAVQEAVSACAYYKCQRAAVITNSTFTRQAKELAAEGGVILWDRNAVFGFIAAAEGRVSERTAVCPLKICRFTEGLCADEEMNIEIEGEGFVLPPKSAVMLEISCRKKRIVLRSGRKKAEIKAELTESPLTLAAGFAGKKLFIGEISVKQEKSSK